MKTKIFLLLFIGIGLVQLFTVETVNAREEKFTFSGINKLVVEGSFFSVDVAGHSEDTIEAQIIIPDSIIKDGIEVLHKQVNSELTFWVEKKFLSGIKIPFGESPEMAFKVPHECQIEIRNSSGDVIVEGFRAKETKIQTSSGDMEVKGCSTDLELSSSSGEIMIRDCHGNKNLRASSGDIAVLNSDGDLKVKTSSGEQEYEGIKGDIFASSSSGDFSLINHEGGLNLESSSGRQSGRSIRITKDSSFQTSSGKIDFDFVNEIEDFNFDLTSSSGKIEVGSTKAKGRVVIGNGTILIKGKSSSGGQVYR